MSISRILEKNEALKAALPSIFQAALGIPDIHHIHFEWYQDEEDLHEYVNMEVRAIYEKKDGLNEIESYIEEKIFKILSKEAAKDFMYVVLEKDVWE